MTDLPDPVRQALAAHTDDDVIAAVRTGGRHPFGPLGRPRVLSPIWAVVTPARAWLIAAPDERSWVRASGEVDALALERGWTVDTLRACGHPLPVPPGSRAAAQAVVDAWLAAPRGGARVLPPATPQEAPTRAPGAHQADLPDGWQVQVPADPTERWLWVLRTGSVHPVPAWDGRPASLPVEIGVSDQRTVLVARSATNVRALRVVSGPLQVVRRGAVVHVQGEDIDLSCGVFRHEADRVADLSARDAPGRWAAVARHHVEHDALQPAVLTWREAIARGQASESWADIAALAWIACQHDGALTALCHALDTGTLSAAARATWTERAVGWQGRVRSPQHAAAELAEGLGSELAGLPARVVPSLLPWPPSDAAGLWVGALASLGRWADAAAAASALDEDARSLEVRAALHQYEGTSDVANAWRAAASAWRPTRPVAARRCLAHALAVAETATDRWLAGAWSWSDDLPDEARAAWSRALLLDPVGRSLEALPDAGAWRCLAELAEGRDAHELAARCWAGVLAHEAHDIDATRRLAHLRGDVLGGRSAACDLLVGLAEHLEDTGEDPAPIWLEAAGFASGTTRIEALSRAVAAGFLHVEVHDAALQDPNVPPSHRAWWEHLRGVVGGGSRSHVPGVSPRAFLGAAERDALHPGELGWREQLRASLSHAALPDRELLVRGLDPLERGHPEAASLVHELAVALRMPPPDGFLYRGDGAWGATAWPTTPSILLLGAAHAAEGPRHLSGAALRFALAVELAHLAAGHPILDVDRSVAGTGRSLYRAFGRYTGTAEDVVDLVTLVPGIDHLARIEKLIRVGRRVFAARKAVDKATHLASPWLERGERTPDLIRGLAREGLVGAQLQARVHADRIALALTGDLDAAVQAILRTSTGSVLLAQRAAHEGLAALLSDPTSGLAPDEALRLTSLLAWAARVGPSLGAQAIVAA